MIMHLRRFVPVFLMSILIGIFPLVLLWRINIRQTTVSAVAPSFAMTLLFAAVVFIVWLLIVRSLEKTVLLSFLTTIFIFSYGHLLNVIRGIEGLDISWSFFIIFFGYLVIFGILFFLVFRMEQVRPQIPLILLPIAALTLFNLTSIGLFFLKHAQYSDPAPIANLIDNTSSEIALSHTLPDIYFIVLDAYAREDMIMEVVGYDNSDFLESLRGRGFYIPACAHSNHSATMNAMASVLNFEYYDPKEDNSFKKQLIHHSKARKIFESYGYKFVTARGFLPEIDIHDSDIYLNFMNEQGLVVNLDKERFTSLYLDTTIFHVLSEMINHDPEKFSILPFWFVLPPAEANHWYMHNLSLFDTLEKIPEWPGQHFVYAHINAPHSPYVFNRDGSFRFATPSMIDEKILYEDTLIYLNQRTLKMVDSILEKSSIAPIIIIQGDHGIHGLTVGFDKLKILSAYYLPGDLSLEPYDLITPVNNFPLILHNYFDPSIQLLPDMLWVNINGEFSSFPASCDLGNQ
jgi:hypothetical protein